MTAIWDRFNEAKSFIEIQWDKKPKVAIVLGSGFSSLEQEIEIDLVIKFSDIPFMKTSRVEHHKGELVLGRLSGQDVMVFSGRYHHYEGYSAEDIVSPVRLSNIMGVEKIILTNSSGAIRSDLNPGDILMITDQINFTGDNPLKGDNEYKFGPRFPSMHEPYSKRLQELVARTALKCNVMLQKGVYVGVNGPSLETPAEYRMLGLLGADVVGMSTVFETIAAVHCGIEVIGLSVVTDAVSVGGGALKPSDAKKASKKAEISINKLIKKVMEKLCVKSISNQ